MVVSLVALENIRNNSICIKDSEGVRNIRDKEDLLWNCTVYVENFSRIGEAPIELIRNGEYARCIRTNIIF